MAGVNLQTIDIPTFDGNILNLRFWERFQADVQDKQHLAEIDKLTYLRDALKHGPACKERDTRAGTNAGKLS